MKTQIFGLLAAVLTAANVSAADIGSVSWDESNVDVLRQYDKAAVEDFVNHVAGDGVMRAKVGEFVWAALGGSTQYSLVAKEDLSGRGLFDYVAVYHRNASGKVSMQWLEGIMVPALKDVIRDIDGDGKAELIIPTEIDSHGDTGSNPLRPVAAWPKIYALHDGKYEDASADYPTFYDKEVLPKLNEKIGQLRARIAAQGVDTKPGAEGQQSTHAGDEKRYSEGQLDALETGRAKILQTLGRK